MKLVTLLGVFLLITAGAWASPSLDCAKGPEYWCRDQATAKRCGAERHCQQTVWRENEQKKPLTSHETAQMLCNVLVQASTELLTHNSINVDSIKEYLRKDCTKLPDQVNLAQQCKMAVDLYVPDILRHLKSGTEAAKICPILQGHDTSNVIVPKPKLSAITPNQTCVLCEFVIHILQTFATANASAQELTQLLENVCRAMPSVLRDECKSFVDAYGPDMVALLVREFDPTKVCELIKVCPKPKNVAFLTKPNVHTCGLCDYVSTYLSSGQAIDNVCKYFSTENNLKQQCEILTHLYKPNMCAQLPLCAKGANSESVQHPIRTAIKSAECSLCKYVVTYLDNVIQNNRSEAAIEAALEKVCGILPAPIKDKCVQFVDAYGPILVQLLEKYATPDQVCNALKLCNNGTNVAGSVADEIVTSMKKINNGNECTLCKYIISYVDLIIQSNGTAEDVKKALQFVCGILPAKDHDKCNQFVETYGPILAELIAELGDPNTVCQWLGICSKSDNKFIAIPSLKPKNLKEFPCTLCEYLVNYLDAIVQSNSTETKIEEALDKACKILPGVKLQSECKIVVHLYGGDIFKLLVEYGDPKAVCQKIGLCDK